MGPMNGPSHDERGHRSLGLDSNRQLEFGELTLPSARRSREPVEFKVVALRDCPLPEYLHECDTPQKAADYWRLQIASALQFNEDLETMVALHLNTRRRIRGHHVVATGTLDAVHVHSREVFRTAIVAASSAILLMHNHPSGDPTPSEADIRVTRELIRAGQLLRLEVLDHVIVGARRHSSLRELGYFA